MLTMLGINNLTINNFKPLTNQLGILRKHSYLCKADRRRGADYLEDNKYSRFYKRWHNFIIIALQSRCISLATLTPQSARPMSHSSLDPASPQSRFKVQ